MRKIANLFATLLILSTFTIAVCVGCDEDTEKENFFTEVCRENSNNNFTCWNVSGKVELKESFVCWEYENVGRNICISGKITITPHKLEPPTNVILQAGDDKKDIKAVNK